MVTEIAYIALGSNLGDRVENCKRAVEFCLEFLEIVSTSSFYETEPLGFEEQPFFINAVVKATTPLDPGSLLAKLLAIENAMGRERRQENGPRTIDLDILFYGNHIVKRPHLTIPHPRAHIRRFILEPLCEIEPGMIHPVFGETVAVLLRELEDDKSVRKLRP